MNKLAKTLVDLGNSHPELRGHLRPILAHLDKQAANPMANLTFDELFGELRSAVNSNDAGTIVSVRSIMAYKFKQQFEAKVKPYLVDILLRRVKGLRDGDTFTIYVAGSRPGSVTPTKLVMETDHQTLQSTYPSKSILCYVKKARGRKTGTLSYHAKFKDLYYQATMNTQTEVFHWLVQG